MRTKADKLIFIPVVEIAKEEHVLETICEKELLKTFVAESQVADDVVVVVVSPAQHTGK